jgi:hypothetical protein
MSVEIRFAWLWTSSSESSLGRKQPRAKPSADRPQAPGHAAPWLWSDDVLLQWFVSLFLIRPREVPNEKLEPCVHKTGGDN